jgi:hypothetical protein
LRTLGVICGILLLGITVHGGQENKPKANKTAVKAAPKARKTTPKKASPAEKPNTQGGLVVVVDPATRQIREATPEDIRAAGAGGPGPQAPTPPQLIQGPGGAVGAVLGPEHQTFTVVSRTPDGQVHMEEVNGEKAAQERVGPSQTPKSKNEK